MSDPDERFIISGIREDGKPLRPTDWVERLSSVLASFDENRRLRYSDSVQPCIIGGEKCLVVARGLETVNPAAYAFVMDFARSNGLRILADRRQGERALPAHPPAA